MLGDRVGGAVGIGQHEVVEVDDRLDRHMGTDEPALEVGEVGQGAGGADLDEVLVGASWVQVDDQVRLAGPDGLLAVEVTAGQVTQR